MPGLFVFAAAFSRFSSQKSATHPGVLVWIASDELRKRSGKQRLLASFRYVPGEGGGSVFSIGSGFGLWGVSGGRRGTLVVEVLKPGGRLKAEIWGRSAGRKARPFLAMLSVGLLMATLGISLTGYVGGLIADSHRERMQHDTLSRLAELRARLEAELEQVESFARGIASFAALSETITSREFRGFAQQMAALDPHVVRASLAPDRIVRFVYPLYGNLSRLGHDHQADDRERQAVLRARQTRSVAIMGPQQDAAGNRTLVAFAPVMRPVSSGSARVSLVVRGVAAVTIDLDSLLASVGLSDADTAYRFALQEQGRAGRPGELLFGDEALFGSDAVRLPVMLTAGRWNLAGAPRADTCCSDTESMVARIIGYGVTLLLMTLAVLAVHFQMRARDMAVHDPLTGLPNRRLLEGLLQTLAARANRMGKGFEIFFIDLNGFKPVNDTHGHAAGDMILRAIGERLRDHTRRLDTVARVGGDEFVVVVPCDGTGDTTPMITARLHAALAEPFEVEGALIHVRASVGSARFPDDTVSIGELLELADRRMYAEKLAAA